MDKQVPRNPSGLRPAPFRVEKALNGGEALPDTPGARRALEEARAEGEKFLARYPSWKSLREKAAAPEPRPRARPLPFRPRAWLAAAAGLALCIVTARFALDAVRSPQDLAMKGGPWFSMIVGGRPALAGREAEAAPGDTVQVFLHHDKPLHYAVFYRDDGGPWELYFASPGEAPASLRGAPLAHDIVLAPVWRIEEIAALAGGQPPGGAGRDCLPKSWVPEIGAAKAAAPEAVPSHCREFTLNLFRLRNAR